MTLHEFMHTLAGQCHLINMNMDRPGAHEQPCILHRVSSCIHSHIYMAMPWHACVHIVSIQEVHAKQNNKMAIQKP